MRRVSAIVAVAAIVVVSGPLLPARDAHGQPAVTQQVAFVVRVPQTEPISDPTAQSRPPSNARRYENLAGSLARWAVPPLDRVPVALAVSPALCEELVTLDPPEGRALVTELRELARRATVLAVPYADAWLPFLTTSQAVEQELADGAAALQACLGKRPSDVLFAHVLDDEGDSPVDDLDDQVVDGARASGITTVVANGVTQTPVRTGAPLDTHLEVVPFSRSMPELDEDGAVRDAPPGARIAVIVDHDSAPADLRDVERLVASERVSVVGIGELADTAPEVSIAFPDDPDVDRRTLDAATSAAEAVTDITSILLRDDPLRVRLRTTYAHALADASRDEYAKLALGKHGRSGRDRCTRIERYVRDELAKITVAEGAVTFTSRRGSVPVTVSNAAAYPVKIRLTVRSPKLGFPEFPTREFPDGASVVRTIEPPGDTITFDALANSSGTFAMTVVLGSREVTLDRTEITVRSTAANLPVLILTIGGALFLLVVYGQRMGRRRRQTA